MSTGLILFVVAGILIGLAVYVAVLAVVPAHPDLADAVARVEHRSPGHARDASDDEVQRDSTERLGNWAMRVLPAAAWARTPERELALLRISHERFYGKKVFGAVAGFLIPPLLTTLFTVLGWHLPFVIPALASPVLAGFLFFAPNLDAVANARDARAEFRVALGSYIDFVALERAATSGPRQAMEVAASIGNTWVFTRIAEDLARSRWSGVPPWDSLRALSQRLGLPELDDFAHIMRLSGEQSTAVYESLRARAESMRDAINGDQLAAANEIGERMAFPSTLMAVAFMGLLVAPALLEMVAHT
jgi:hypothetical protein